MPSEPMNPVDLKRIRTIVEVSQASAITTAAERLGLTQSAVSRSVAEVEDSLGVRLFDRLPRGIQLTEAGHRFVARAYRVLAEAEDLVNAVRERPGVLTGRLRVGVTACGEHATWLLGSLAHEYPGIAIETSAGTPQEICPALLRGDLDLVVGAVRFLERWSDLEVTGLAALHFACILRKDHPLSRVEKPSELDVLGYPSIFPASIAPTFSDIAQRYAHHGLPGFQPRYVTNDFELIKRLVAKTDAFFPFTHPSESFGGLGKDFLVLRDVLDMPRYELGFATRAERRAAPAVAALAELLIERLSARRGRHRSNGRALRRGA